MAYVIGRINVKKRKQHYVRKIQVLPLLTLWDLAQSERAEFDYVSDSEDSDQQRFVRYRGNVLDVCDTQFIGGRTMGDFPDSTNQFSAWDGIATDSHWSGIVFRFLGPDTVKVGTWIGT